MEKYYTLGLDLGVASVGWCLYEGDECYFIDEDGVVQTDKNDAPIVTHNLKRIVDLGSLVFSELEDGKSGKTENYTRGLFRRMRRQRRRKVHRLERLRDFFKEKFNVDFLNDVIAKRNSFTLATPFELKIMGLHSQLTKEELMIVLYHYMKYRGFKSNRKAAENENKDDKKLLKTISDIKKNLENNQITISEYLINKQKEQAATSNISNVQYCRIHNSGTDNDFFFIDRKTYVEEIERLLNTQIQYSLIDEEFKDEYLKLYNQQRSFSTGPGYPSKYKVDFNKLRGTCIFDNEKRAIKDSITARRFILLSALNNFRYIDNDVKKGLTPEQICRAEKVIIAKEKYEYSDLLKLLNLENAKIPGLTIANSKRKKIISDYAKEHNLMLPLDERYWNDISAEVEKAKLSNVFFKNSNLVYKIASSKNHSIQAIRTNDEFYDDIASILFSAKDDASITEQLKNKNYPDDVIEGLLKLNIDCKQTINLSDSICKKLIPLLRQGKQYDDAMKQIGYSHTNKWDISKAQQEIPPIDDALKEMNIVLTNPVVKNTMINMRKIINALLKKYGHIDECVIEMTRELKKPFEERNKIRKSQLENYENNTKLKVQLLEKYPKLFSISKDDLIKYRLFNEQQGVCVYSGELIDETKLFDKDYLEIDHILPYSRSFDDSYDNKALVLTKSNRLKGNRLPSEVEEGDLFKHVNEFLSAHKNYPSAKRNNLLCKGIPEGFINKNLTDTSYITNIAKQLISYYVVGKEEKCRTTNGQITNILKKQWGLTGKTHTYALCGDGTPVSYENDCYQAKFNLDYKFKEVDITKSDELIFKFKIRKIIGNDILEDDFPVSLKLVEKKGGKELSLADQYHNDAIADFKNVYPTLHKKFFLECIDKPINEILYLIKGDHLSLQYSTEEYREHIEYLNYILRKILSDIQKDIDEKNRNNDLHHALDAAVIGAVTQAIYQKLSNANKKGEPNKVAFDYPYKDFKREVLARVYEHDENKLLRILNDLDPYKEEKLDKHDVHILVPARQPKTKVRGPLSKETIFGVDKLDKSKAVKTISVLDISKKNIEKIIHKDNGNKAVYKAICKWFDAKKPTKYPILEKKGTFIKKVQIYSGDTISKVALSKEFNRFAENPDVLRVQFYKKKDNFSDNLYAVPIYYHQIVKRKKNEPVLYNLMWAQGENGHKIICNDELNKFYDLIASLPRCSLIEIELKDGSKSLAYSAGASSGFFEIYSLLGDSLDLKRNLNKNPGNRFLLTISSIKSIKVRSISVLGVVS